MKKSVIALLSLLLVIGSYSFSMRTKGFSVQKILSYYPPDSRWESAPPSSEILSLFDHPFSYLGSGNHTYVFLSHDKRYVLKFFKQKHMRTQQFLLSRARKEKRAKERESSYLSYKIAYDKLREETGLCYLHLSKTKDLNQTITLFDQKGKTHHLDGDKMEFLIQKRAELSFRYVEELAEKGDEEGVINSLISLLNVAKCRSLKGLGDRDMQFFKNFGFANGKAVEIDIGEFYFEESKKDPETYKAELQELSYELLSWIDQKAPHLRGEFLKRMEEL